jgi:hypothetical protein
MNQNQNCSLLGRVTLNLYVLHETVCGCITAWRSLRYYTLKVTVTTNLTDIETNYLRDRRLPSRLK